MKMDEIEAQNKSSRTIDKLEEYILSNNDSLFPFYDDPELEKKFPNLKPDTLANYLYMLSKEGTIQKIKINGLLYFGSPQALDNWKKRQQLKNQ